MHASIHVSAQRRLHLKMNDLQKTKVPNNFEQVNGQKCCLNMKNKNKIIIISSAKY